MAIMKSGLMDLIIIFQMLITPKNQEPMMNCGTAKEQ